MCARQLSKLDNIILDSLDKQGSFPPSLGSGAKLLADLQAIGRVHQAAFDRQAKDVLFL